MQTANQSLARLYASGQITLDTAMNASARRDELRRCWRGGRARPANLIGKWARGRRAGFSGVVTYRGDVCVCTGARIRRACQRRAFGRVNRGRGSPLSGASRFRDAHRARAHRAGAARRAPAGGEGPQPGGVHTAAGGDDRRRPAARRLPGSARRRGARSRACARHPADPRRRGAGILACRRDGKAPAVFDSLYGNMIAAGETGGILDTILERLAIYIEKAVKLTGQVTSAIIYPLAVRHHRHGCRGSDPLEGHPNVCGALHRPRCGAAAANANRRRVQRVAGRISALAGCRGRSRQLRTGPVCRHAAGPACSGRASSCPASARAAPSEDCRRKVLPYARHAHRVRSPRYSTDWTSPHRPAATP